MEIKTKYDPETFVYLVHDPDQYKRFIVKILIGKKSREYLLRCGSEEGVHLECELSADRNEAILLNMNDDEK